MATQFTMPSLLKTSSRQFEVAALALHLLGGARRAVDTEDIAIKCHQLSPELFAWRKYPDQVNLELVRVSLSDAKKAKNGILVAGSGRDGWRLTPNGVARLSAKHAENDGAVAVGKSDTTRRSAGSIDTVRKAREELRIQNSAAWAIWKAEQRIDVEEARKLLRIDSYTSLKLIDVKVARLMAVFPTNSKVGKFIDAARQMLSFKGKSDAE